jgi:2-methylcitrate dehydratase PrpD
LRAAVARLAPRSPAHLTEALGVLVTVGAGFEHSRAGFTDASYKPFATALAAARAVLATDRAALTETKAQAAFDTLRAALAGLAPVTDPPKAGKISPAPKPVIKGTAKVGKKLRVAKGAWPAGTSLKTQWYAGGKAIKKATKSTLKLTKALKGKKIRVKVTGTLSGHLKTAVTSKATKKVAKK